MSEISFLRYSSSFIAITCCLILPLTVEWINIPFGTAISSITDPTTTLTTTTTTTTLTDNKSNKEHVSFYYFEIHVLLYHISILACSSFVQLYFYFKLLMMIVGISIYLIGFQMQKSYQAVADSMDTTHFFLFAELFIQLFFFVLFLHLIDRRVIREKIFF
jgi:hypothetical protein